MTLHLYTLSGSPFGWKVQLALEYKGVPHGISLLSPDKGDLNTPWFRALNPHGKLPVLVDDELILFESDAIIAYVDEAFPAFGPNLWARDTKTRALQRMAAIEASNYLYPPIRALVVAWTRPGAHRRTRWDRGGQGLRRGKPVVIRQPIRRRLLPRRPSRRRRLHALSPRRAVRAAGRSASGRRRRRPDPR